MDETIEAAAHAIYSLGEAALQSRAGKLVALAREVALAAVGVGEPVNNLEAAAEVLAQADSATRPGSVVNLLNASIALEAALGVDLDAIRGAAAQLSRACEDPREAAASMEKVRSAAAGRTYKGEEQLAGAWWSSLLLGRRRRRQVGDIEDLEAPFLVKEHPPKGQSDQAAEEVMRAVVIVIDFIRAEEAARPVQLVQLARNVMFSARVVDLPHDKLAEAIDALVQADNTGSPSAVVHLGTAATELEQVASAQLSALRVHAAHLVRACRELQEAATAMATVQRAAMERAQQRDREGRVEEVAAVVVQNKPAPAPAPGQGDERRSGMQGVALFGSLALVPYLAAASEEKPKTLSDDEKWKVSVVFSSLWTVAAVSVLCSSYARTWLEQCCALLLTRASLFGMNIFAMFFVFWMLRVEDTRALHVSVGITFVLHLFFFALACRRRDM